MAETVSTDCCIAGGGPAGMMLGYVMAGVQQRREAPVKRVQAIQMAIHRRVLTPILHAEAPLKVPLAARLLDAIPVLRRIPARIVGMGFNMEHVHVGEAKPRH